ncbi:Fc.00g046640.m01.CDS01 [Cosmosporella sp. VM-42]
MKLALPINHKLIERVAQTAFDNPTGNEKGTNNDQSKKVAVGVCVTLALLLTLPSLSWAIFRVYKCYKDRKEERRNANDVELAQR